VDLNSAGKRSYVAERMGTYSLTFHPQFAKNDFVYVFGNGPNKPDEKKRFNRIWRYTVSRQSPRRLRWLPSS
jgi:hypothetical protein